MHLITITNIEPVFDGSNQLEENGLFVFRVKFNAISANGVVYENNYYQWAIDINDESKLIDRCNETIDYLVEQDSKKIIIPDNLANLVV